MSEIRTNEIIPHFDYQKIDTEYDIFCLETSRKYISTRRRHNRRAPDEQGRQGCPF